jgi:polyisoprenoid-binding protein YceI
MRFPTLAATPLVLLLATAPPAAAQRPVVANWQIDAAHSSVSFRIRHFVTKVPGKFTDFRGSITADPESWRGAAVEVEIRTASISTGNTKRDVHLRSSDFFAADSFPTIVFRSTLVERQGNRTVEGGGAMLGDDVQVEVSVEAVRTAK